MYAQGNLDYLTPEFLGLVKHAVAEAKRLDLEVALTFGPGWGFGGAWVPQEDQSKVLGLGSLDLEGGVRFDGPLPPPDFNNPRRAAAAGQRPPGRLVAVMVGLLFGVRSAWGGSGIAADRNVHDGPSRRVPAAVQLETDNLEIGAAGLSITGRHRPSSGRSSGFVSAKGCAV